MDYTRAGKTTMVMSVFLLVKANQGVNIQSEVSIRYPIMKNFSTFSIKPLCQINLRVED